jgi:hypothetical protein
MAANERIEIYRDITKTGADIDVDAANTIHGLRQLHRFNQYILPTLNRVCKIINRRPAIHGGYLCREFADRSDVSPAAQAGGDGMNCIVLQLRADEALLVGGQHLAVDLYLIAC